MIDKERIACNYTFFRFPNIYVMIIIPVYAGIIAYFSINPLQNYDQGVEDLVYTMIESYLIISKIVMIILASFFITYRWSSMKNDGNYGFWLTQGINRNSFYLLSISSFLGYFLLSSVLGLLMLIYPGGMFLPFTMLVKITFLMLSNLILFIGIAFTIGELVKNPETAALLTISLFSINISVNDNPDSFWHKIFMNDFHFQDDNILVPLFIPAIFGILLIFLNMKYHERRDIEL